MTSPDHVVWLDLLLGQVEREAGLSAGQTGIEAQIEDAGGLAAVDAIAAASPRLEALVFGPADFTAKWPGPSWRGEMPPVWPGGTPGTPGKTGEAQ